MSTIGRLTLLVLILVPMVGYGAHVTPPVTVMDSAIMTSEHFQFAFDATGVQIYRCEATSTAGGFEWHFIAPDAILFDRQNQVAGKHYAGPTAEAYGRQPHRRESQSSDTGVRGQCDSMAAIGDRDEQGARAVEWDHQCTAD